MIEFEFAGRKYEFRGIYRVPETDDLFLTSRGGVHKADWRMSVEAAIVHPGREVVEIGGIVWEKEEAPRKVEFGEWYLLDNIPTFARWLGPKRSIDTHDVIYPVSIAPRREKEVLVNDLPF